MMIMIATSRSFSFFFSWSSLLVSSFSVFFGRSFFNFLMLCYSLFPFLSSCWSTHLTEHVDTRWTSSLVYVNAYVFSLSFALHINIYIFMMENKISSSIFEWREKERKAMSRLRSIELNEGEKAEYWIYMCIIADEKHDDNVRGPVR